MKKQRVYVDTSVIGGCFDPEFAEWSNGLMQDFRNGEFSPLLSEVMDMQTIDTMALIRQIRDNHYQYLRDKA